jgi:hypothetical protein
VRFALCNLEQRGADAVVLRCWQDIEVIYPALAKSNKSNHFSIFEIAPQLANFEHALSEKPSILLWRMEEFYPW